MSERGIPARLKKLEGSVSDLRKRVVDVEEIELHQVQRVDVHDERLDRIEVRATRQGRRITRVQAAISRLRARVLARQRVK